MNQGRQYELSQAAVSRIPKTQTINRKHYLYEMIASLDSQEIEAVIKAVEEVYHSSKALRS